MHADNLLRNVPDETAFNAMVRAGFDAVTFTELASALRDNSPYVLFSNVRPDHNGEYRRDEMRALNVRLLNEIMLLSEACKSSPDFKYVQIKRDNVVRVLGLVNGGKVSRSYGLRQTDGVV